MNAKHASHPYQRLPPRAFWRRSVAQPSPEAVDPVGEFALRLGTETRVATAGSCFAQHIARHLQRSGFCYLVTEPGHPLLPDDVRKAHQYGTYSARYGNVYTARQLVQLVRRAYGDFTPNDDVWNHPEGGFADPFRPTVQPRGFASVEELHADRQQHFAAVREMLETLDVFVFTLGLTEGWVSRRDGAVFPICPGVEGGAFDPDLYAFLNQDAASVTDDLTTFRSVLKRVNRKAQMVLTVSPVPLVATAEPGQHVLTATTYSKSVLRVAAEAMRRTHDDVHYFPSYEIIVGAYNRGRYFADDLRSVTEPGVEHVMRLFLQHAAGVETSADAALPPAAPEQGDTAFIRRAQEIVDVECDEVALDRPA